MISGSTSDILAMALPVVLAIVMGILGTLRGFWREAIVSGSIVLGALIVQQWASLWADDLYGMYTGVSREMQQVALSQLLLSLIVLVLGYGLGSLVRGGRVSSGSRVGGLLLGLANGSAIGGWLLRYIYTSLDGAQPSSPLYQNAVTQTFMIWAGWFPVALAVVGALVALVAPFRRSEVEVTQVAATPAPASAPVWTPPPPVPPYAATNTTTTTAYGAPPPSRMSGPVGAATPYDRTVANLSPYATPGPGPQAPYDAPRTQAFGGLDVPPPAPPRDQYNTGAYNPSPYNPAPYNPGQYDTSTRSFTPITRDDGTAPPTNVLADSNQGSTSRQAPLYRSGIGETLDTGSTVSASPGSGSGSGTAQQPSTAVPEALRPSSDWLAASTVATPAESVAQTDAVETTPTPAESVAATEAVETVATPTESTSSSGAVEVEAPQTAGQVVEEDASSTPEQREVETGASVADETSHQASDEAGEAPVTATSATTYTPTEVTCANCGATVLSNARFCFECGTSVTTA